MRTLVCIRTYKYKRGLDYNQCDFWFVYERISIKGISITISATFCFYTKRISIKGASITISATLGFNEKRTSIKGLSITISATFALDPVPARDPAPCS